MNLRALRALSTRVVACSLALCAASLPAGLPAGVAPSRAATASAGDSTATAGVLDTLYVAPPIVVNADRVDPIADLRNRPGFVTMVDLAHRRDRVEDLGTVLDGLVGVHVTQYGGLGSFATASIRGSSSNQVRVYLDGVPVDDAYLGVTDLSDLPLGGVERVEVFRGFTPPSLGPSTIGGAINLVTFPDAWKRHGSHTRVDARESYGSFDTSRHRLSVWSEPGPVRFFVHGGYTHSTGDFEFVDDNGTPETSADDELTRRTNDAFEAWNALARAEVHAPRVGTVAFGHDVERRRQGLPGLGSHQSLTARSERARRLSFVRLSPRDLLPRTLRVDATGYYGKTVERFHDPDATLGTLARDTDNTMLSYGGRARAKWFVSWAPVSLEAVFDGRKEQFHPADKLPAPTSGPDRWRRSTTTAVTGELYLLADRLVLSATQRFERFTSEFYDAPRFPWLPPTPQGRVTHDRRSPSAGVRWRVTPALTVKADAGRYYRVPTFLELFGNTGSVTGNAALAPEEGKNVDAGVVFGADRAAWVRKPFLEVVWLTSWVDNLILYFPNSQYTSKPENIGSARIRGWEVSASGAIGDRGHIAAAYTWLHSEDTSDIPYYRGNDLPSRPRHDLDVSASWRAGPCRLRYELHYLGANYLDRANLRQAPERTIHDAVVCTDLPAVRGLSLTLEVRNLTDDRVSDVSGYPLPGRSVYTTLSYQLASPGGQR